ncbi:MAG: tRNA (adenosine(37)-N6)-threonylcarbamoyltransferase complex transferase subunit TsaD [candidate division Zixibacteria bacterium]
MIVLGIETSCDETSAAVVRDGRKILSNCIYSQEIHQKYGGVVPELASREHIKKLIPIINEALNEANMSLNDIDIFAATYGPGLVGALLVGLTAAKSMAYASGKDFCAVNHLEGHIAANLLAHHDVCGKFLTLLVSGGHTMLIDVMEMGKYTVLGKTLDDAAGEAFDKVAKILGLGYPGGAAIDKLAREGNPDFIKFPRAVLKKNSLDFSYSGLKTAVALYVQKLSRDELEAQKADIAASFQEATIDVLVKKSKIALNKTTPEILAISGGVAANSRLRKKMSDMCHSMGVRLIYPPLNLCTDNAAMIAGAAYFQFMRGEISELTANAVPYQKLGENIYAKRYKKGRK